MRHFKLHEYQAGALLHSYDVQVPLGNVAKSPEEAEAVSTKMNQSGYVVKAQVLAGGRGLGHFKENGYQGGVHIVDTPA